MSNLTPTNSTSAIQSSVRDYLQEYFSGLGDSSPENVYQKVLELVEQPLLEEVLKKAGNNQCKATRILGLARGTVIKKLKFYGLIKPKTRAGAVKAKETLEEEEVV